MLKRSTGARGETAVCRYLRLRGYLILERNYRKKCGEIDIIARRGRYLCFVEVKTRSKNAMGEPSRYVTFQKQRKIIKTASAFLCVNNFELMPRFDIAEVSKIGLLFKVRYIKNAFCVNEHNDPTYCGSC